MRKCRRPPSSNTENRSPRRRGGTSPRTPLIFNCAAVVPTLQLRSRAGARAASSWRVQRAWAGLHHRHAALRPPPRRAASPPAVMRSAAGNLAGSSH